MNQTPSILERIVAAGVKPALAVLRELRPILLKSIFDPQPTTVLGVLRSALASNEPVLAHSLRDSLLLSWLKAAGQIARKLPFRFEPMPAPSIRVDYDPRQPIRLPAIEKAVEDLSSRDLLTQAQYNQLDRDARRTAFTVARLSSVDAIGKVRQAVLKDVRQGGSLKKFRGEVAEALDGILSASQIETLYRTHVGQAYAVGQKQILSSPFVADAFPYLLWSAVHDSRVEPSHLKMERHGQNGSAVYRADDPMWEVLYPPCRWNCRCHAIALSIEDAAKHGSEEAKRWLQTGRAPLQPEFARRPYPITPPDNWPTGPRIQTIAV